MFDPTAEQKALVRAAARFCAGHADPPELTGDVLTRARRIYEACAGGALYFLPVTPKASRRGWGMKSESLRVSSREKKSRSPWGMSLASPR